MVGNARHKRMKTNPLPVIALGILLGAVLVSRSSRRDERTRQGQRRIASLDPPSDRFAALTFLSTL